MAELQWRGLRLSVIRQYGIETSQVTHLQAVNIHRNARTIVLGRKSNWVTYITWGLNICGRSGVFDAPKPDSWRFITSLPPPTILLSYSVFNFPYFFVSVPCARLSCSSRRLLGRTLIYRIVFINKNSAKYLFIYLLTKKLGICLKIRHASAH